VPQNSVPQKASLALLCHMRWLAALAVGISHIRQNLYLDHAQNLHAGIVGAIIYFFGAYGPAGVIVFFVLSGFLVGGKAVTLLYSPNIDVEWRHFFFDRFSRIFIVLWPALAVAALVMLALRIFAPDAPFMALPHWGWSIQHPLNQDFSLRVWAGDAALLNGFAARTAATDAPVWSLAYEWLYYMIALASVLLIRRVFSWGSSALILYAIGLVALSVIFTPVMLYLGLIWVLGTIAHLVFDRQMIRGVALRYGSLALLIGLLVLDRFSPLPQMLLGFAVALVIAHHGWSDWNYGSRWGGKLADFSYSFYMVHYPVIIAAMAVLYRLGRLQNRLSFQVENLFIGICVLGIAIVFARGFAFVTEDRTGELRKALLRGFQIPTRRPAAALPAE
jgi:peptidoglycan/LPS O-acetylase OafA/YrhL